MRRRTWLIALCLYAIAGIADSAYRMSQTREVAADPAAAVLVAFCAGLFWPVDLASRLLLAPR